MTKNAIGIFVKTPGLSPIKTRLAADIGEEKAMALYHLCLQNIQEITKDVDADIFWAIGEENGLSNPLWQGFERLWTGPGGLGERQHHIYSSLRERYENAMLLGVDCPQISADVLNQAFEALNENNFCLGPSTDGGYNYFAGKLALPKDVWMSISYSQPDTRKTLCEFLYAPVSMGRPLTDVDHQSDLHGVVKEMPDKPVSPQVQIMNWIKNLT